MMKKKEQKRINGKRLFTYLVLILLAIICLFPFYILIINATRAHADIQKGFSMIPGAAFLFNLKNVLNNANLPVLSGIRNSVVIAGCGALISAYISAMTAYAVHIYDFRWKRQLYTFILLIMMVPGQVSALGFIRWMGTLGLLDNLIPLIIPAAAAPSVVFFIKQYMESNLPVEIIEAARADGAGEFYIFNIIILPILEPAIAVQMIFSFVGSWNNYLIPSLILKKDEMKTLPILIAQLRSADFLKFDMGQVYMLIFIAIIPVCIVYIALSRYIVGGLAVGSVKG